MLEAGRDLRVTLPGGLLPAFGISQQDAIHLDPQATRAFLNQVAIHPDGSTHRGRMLATLFESVADYLRGWVSSGKRGILVSDGLCSGRVTSGLVAQRDASTFVVGAVNVSVPGPLLFTGNAERPVSFIPQDQDGVARNVFLGPLGKIVDLPADIILGVNGDIKRGHCDVHISMRDGPTVSNRFDLPDYNGPHRNHSDVALASWRYSQTMATLCGLHQLALWFRMNNVPAISASLMQNTPGIPTGRIIQREPIASHWLPGKVASTTEAIRRECEKTWREMVFPLVERLNVGKISLAESFTGGALASLLHSIPRVARRTDHEIVWYNEKMKRECGIQTTMLTDSAIIDPRTMTCGGIELIHASPHTTTAITTSGWTNLIGRTDSFGVAVVNKIPGYYRIVRAQCTIENSENWPSGPERKAFAREAGVAVSLLTFSRLLIGMLPRGERRDFAKNLLKLAGLVASQVNVVQETVKVPILRSSVSVAERESCGKGNSTSSTGGESAPPTIGTDTAV